MDKEAAWRQERDMDVWKRGIKDDVGIATSYIHIPFPASPLLQSAPPLESALIVFNPTSYTTAAKSGQIYACTSYMIRSLALAI